MDLKLAKKYGEVTITFVADDKYHVVIQVPSAAIPIAVLNQIQKDAQRFYSFTLDMKEARET